MQPATREALNKTVALDPRTRSGELPRETVRMVRSDVAKALGRTIAMTPSPMPIARTPLASTIAIAPPVQARAPLASTLAIAMPMPAAPAPAHVHVPALAPALAPPHAPAHAHAHAPVFVPQRPHYASAAQPAPSPMKTCSPTADPRLVMLADPKGPQAAGFRLLRDTLVAKGMPRVLAVSSPESGDGTTTCAINLAIALAEDPTKKVLLLDANFAAPAIGELLGVDETEASRSWCAPFTLSALTPSLHVATLAPRAGHGRQSSSYVDFTTLARLLEAFQRGGYHYIVLDTPPVESSPEAALLLHLAGGVLLAVRSGSSTTGALRRCVDRIGLEKAVGVTLMDAPN